MSPRSSVSEQVLASFLEESRLAGPSEFPAIVAHHARMLGATNADVYVVDRQQVSLCVIGDEDSRVPIEGTLAGRVFTTTQPLWTDIHDGCRLLLPVQDGIERLGVLALDLAEKDGS